MSGTRTRRLFTVEYEDGEMIDISGDGGFSVFTSRGEAQDALDTKASSIYDPDLKLAIVEWSSQRPTAQSQEKEAPDTDEAPTYLCIYCNQDCREIGGVCCDSGTCMNGSILPKCIHCCDREQHPPEQCPGRDGPEPCGWCHQGLQLVDGEHQVGNACRDWADIPGVQDGEGMTAYEKICAEACGLCAAGHVVEGGDHFVEFEYRINGERYAPCTAPTRDAVIERLAGHLAQIDEILIVNNVGPRLDGDYKQALADLIAITASGRECFQRDELRAVPPRVQEPTPDYPCRSAICHLVGAHSAECIRQRQSARAAGQEKA